MAKKNKKATKLSSRMNALAEDLGTFLGSSERKATEWLSRQQQLRKQLSAIRDRATALLSQLGPSAERGDQGRKGKAAGKVKKADKAKKAQKAKKGDQAKSTVNAKARKAVKRSAKLSPRPVKPVTKAPKPAPSPAASMLEPDIDDLDAAMDE